MLQALLRDRFKLDVRREMREMPVYAVVIAKNGPKIEKAKIEDKDCPDGSPETGVSCHQINGGQGRGLHGQAVTIDDIARYVGNWTDRPVVDRTDSKVCFTWRPKDGYPCDLPRYSRARSHPPNSTSCPVRPAPRCS